MAEVAGRGAIAPLGFPAVKEGPAAMAVAFTAQAHSPLLDAPLQVIRVAPAAWVDPAGRSRLAEQQDRAQEAKADKADLEVLSTIRPA